MEILDLRNGENTYRFDGRPADVLGDSVQGGAHRAGGSAPGSVSPHLRARGDGRAPRRPPELERGGGPAGLGSRPTGAAAQGPADRQSVVPIGLDASLRFRSTRRVCIPPAPSTGSHPSPPGMLFDRPVRQLSAAAEPRPRHPGRRETTSPAGVAAAVLGRISVSGSGRSRSSTPRPARWAEPLGSPTCPRRDPVASRCSASRVDVVDDVSDTQRRGRAAVDLSRLP